MCEDSRNNNIDILKAICAFEVVFAHVPFIKFELIDPHFAVPCFLMISGYFIFSPSKERMDERIIRSINRIVWICLWSTAIYFVYDGFYMLRNGEDLFNSSKVVNWILFNQTIYGTQLWYLFAYLYVLIIVYFFNKKRWLFILTWAAPFLLVLNLLFGTYSVFIFGVDPPIYQTRNFLGIGIPFFTIGMLIKEMPPPPLPYMFLVYLQNGLHTLLQ